MALLPYRVPIQGPPLQGPRPWDSLAPLRSQAGGWLWLSAGVRLGFRLEFGWLFVGFGLISAGFRLDFGLISVRLDLA